MKKFLFVLCTGVCLVLFVVEGTAQKLNNTLYLMPDIPQRNQENPAFSSKYCEGYVSIPILGSLYGNYTNSSFSLDDIAEGNYSLWSGDSIEIDMDALYDNLNEQNYISGQAEVGLFSAGIKRGDAFFTFDITDKIDTRASFNNEVLDFLKTQNENLNLGSFDFGDFKLDGTYYREIAFGYSKKLRNEVITLGVRGKLLFGLANVHLKEATYTFDYLEDGTSVRFASTQEIQTSLPLDEVRIGSNGYVSELVVDESSFFNTNLFANTSNIGIGVDFGALFRINEVSEVYASIADIGFISWKDNLYTFSQETDVIIEDFPQSFDPDAPNYEELEDIVEQLVDSVENRYELDSTQSYVTSLPLRIYLGGNYEASEFLTLGAVCRFDTYGGAIRPALTLAGNYKILSKLNASLSYTAHNNSFFNLGLGVSSKLGPLQVYFVSDNIAGLLTPKKTRNTNFRFGINYYFGCRKYLRDECDYEKGNKRSY